jgi:hypothetical protein
MQAMSKRENQEFLRVLSTIQDEKVRYFYVMLGEAIGESIAKSETFDADVKVNTSLGHIEDLARRLNAHP